MPKSIKQIYDESPRRKARSSSAEPQATPAQTRSTKQQRNSDIPEVKLQEINSNLDSSSTEETSTEITDAQMQIFQKLLKENTDKLSAKHEQQMQQREIEIDLLKDQLHHLELQRIQPDPEFTIDVPKTPRPQDLQYQQLLQSTKKEKKSVTIAEGSIPEVSHLPNTNRQPDNTNIPMNMVLQLMEKFVSTQDKDTTTTDLPKFSGHDAQWPKWYQLLRSYLQAKGWLETFDHDIGPGTPDSPTPDFDHQINQKIYQKIQAKCFDRAANVYVRMAAEFDGHGAGVSLRNSIFII